jgi:hypothetical protein
MKCLCFLSVAAAAVAVALVVWEFADPPQPRERLCDHNDASILHDPDFVVTGITVDVATGCIVSVRTRPR